MVLFLPSASDIATGDAEAVGVHYVAATEKHPTPLRIYYPAAHNSSSKEVGYFRETSAAYFVQGYWGVIMGNRDTLLYKIGSFVLSLLASILPLNYLKVKGVYQDATPAVDAGNDDDNKTTTKKKLPLILFSHGLTGTGQENAVLCSAWAKQGYVVIAVHHTDGSSNRVRTADGNDLWYDHGPPMTEYDAEFRPKQIKERANDLVRARQFMVSSLSSSSSQSQQSVAASVASSLIDWNKTIVAGFSYGAATAALLAARKKESMPSLVAVVLLDGWFYVDVAKSAGIEFEFPREAFEGVDNDHLKDTPAIFINSSQFQKMPKMWKATEELATRFQTASPQYVIEDSLHNNFCDLVFWFPTWLLQKCHAIGNTEPKQACAEIVRLTLEFLKKQQQQA